MKCEICGGEAVLEHSCVQPGRAFEDVSVEYWACIACGAARRLPLPDKQELRSYYESSWQFSEPRPSRCFNEAALFIQTCIGKTAQLVALDVGAKDSTLLKHLHAEPHAVDAQPVSDGVTQAWFGEGYESERSYQLIVATHVLEHSIDPHAFMHDVVECMEVGGWLYIEVPTLEQGALDISACDDLNPNHLWHFTLRSLVVLMEAAGLLVVRAQTDNNAVGWPCNRIMAKRALRCDTINVAAAEGLLYAGAVRKIMESDSKNTGLYGASFSCWKLLRAGVDLPVYDLYKTGEILGRPIFRSSLMLLHGIERVWLTPRFWNSQQEISKFLARNHPDIEVLCPY